jgi:hypothetical protein
MILPVGIQVGNCSLILPLNHLATSNLNISGLDFLEIVIIHHLPLVIQLIEMHRHLSVDLIWP